MFCPGGLGKQYGESGYPTVSDFKFKTEILCLSQKEALLIHLMFFVFCFAATL